MKILEKNFVRKKIIYETIERTDKTGLFKLFIKVDGIKTPVHVGWEVSKIIANEAREIAGVTIPEHESIVGDEAFGLWSDSDKSMFPYEFNRAKDYFKEYDEKLHRENLISIKN